MVQGNCLQHKIKRRTLEHGRQCKSCNLHRCICSRRMFGICHYSTNGYHSRGHSMCRGQDRWGKEGGEGGGGGGVAEPLNSSWVDEASACGLAHLSGTGAIEKKACKEYFPWIMEHLLLDQTKR